jgi:putative hydrolase of the HAD superfamily
MAKAKKKAVFFDAGGTLFAPHPSVGRIYADAAAKYGMYTDADEIEKIFREEFARRDRMASFAHATEKNEKEWWRALVREVFGKVTELRNFDSFFEYLYDLFARPEVWQLYPEVPRVLKALKEKRLVLGIVSNWDSRLLSICEGMRVDRAFDFILASALVGSAKPDAGIFKRALELARVSPGEALHVGDSVENDCLGAKRARIDALLINRSGREGVEVEWVKSLDEIVSYVE